VRLTVINQFYVPDLSPTAHLVASLAEHRSTRGDEVTVIAGRGGYLGGAPSTPSAPPGGVRVLRIWTPGFGKTSELHRLLDYMSFLVLSVLKAATLPRQDFVITLTTPPYVVLAGLVHKLVHRRARVVLWHMDLFPDALEGDGWIRKGGWPSRSLRAVNRAIYGALDAVVCLDDAMRERVVSHYAPPDGRLRVSVVPNWERLRQFPAPGERPSDGSRSFQAHPFSILYLGNAGHNHPFETVIAAAEALKAEPVRFVFVGGGTRWPWLHAQKETRGLESLVLRPYVAKERTPEVLAEADCALITLRESLRGVVSPSKLHGSLAMGLPILYLGPAGTNVDEAIRRFRCGLSVREGDTEAVVAFILRLMNDRALRDELRRRAREAFETAYCDEVSLPLLDSVIDAAERPMADPPGGAS
jgi:glycosyltransferase involved in cell wall biosynthesis